MDIADQAAEQEAKFLEEALYKQSSKQSQGQSLSHCLYCGEPIPIARQKAIAGVCLCISCQQYKENNLS